MARKDYVKSSAPKRRNSKKAPPRQTPWIAIGVFGVFALAFIYVLVQLNNRPDEPAPKVQEKPQAQPKEQPKTQAPPKATQAPASQPKETLPQKPKEEWRYVETLKNKEVEVEVPVRPKSNTPYQMQCGSFRNYDQAETQKAKLAFVGLESQVRKTGDWYRVVLGPYEGKRAAQNEQHRAEKAGFPNCAIWPWR
ncbi:SPOR domain-containing protein [Gallaecimonas xiamenensis]|uniref:Sporulation domain-containing protein n=1 Tax=Gallaecimonas xiamenensis 3-C-1 TaxID=745411 RepID=K2KIF4_9GAMM|nr:SPOR domain-containing protein [Gallaecimonas xiamenensis]EKE77045.1 sporulation domain-containing protein [Gallaecimonas xiamenensis 3-C-1]